MKTGCCLVGLVGLMGLVACGGEDLEGGEFEGTAEQEVLSNPTPVLGLSGVVDFAVADEVEVAVGAAGNLRYRFGNFSDQAGYTRYPGTWTSIPAGIVRVDAVRYEPQGDGVLWYRVFAINNAGDLVTALRRGNSWAAFENLGRDGAVGGIDVAATAIEGGQGLRVFTVGTDRQVRYREWLAGSGWSEFTVIPGIAARRISAANNFVAVVTTAGVVAYSRLAADQWLPWANASADLDASDVSATAWGGTTELVLARPGFGILNRTFAATSPTTGAFTAGWINLAGPGALSVDADLLETNFTCRNRPTRQVVIGVLANPNQLWTRHGLDPCNP